MEFSFELATPKDDPALRDLLATTPMPGRVSVAFEREPNYFAGCTTMGPFYQVLIARHNPSGDIAAVVCRAVRPHYINGKLQDLGYIGGIRVTEKYRARWLLQSGLSFFRQLHADQKAQVYWGAISAENSVSRGVLVERRRRNFPNTRQVARIYTLAIILRKKRPPLPFIGQIERGSIQSVPEIISFLQEFGAQRQFFPVYSATDFTEGKITRGFDIDDFFIARRDGAIVGVMGLWDQSGYKQSVVRGYDRSLRMMQPFYNLAARWLGMQPLTAIGHHIHSAYASFICVANDDPNIFATMLRETYNLAAERRYAYLMLGLAQNDPLLPIAKKFAHIAYHSQVYLGSWDEDVEIGSFCESHDERIPYIEIASL